MENLYPLELNLGHLYPEHLNLYGDYGNILAFKQICKLRKIKLNYYKLSLDDDLKPDTYDIFFMGGGQNSEQTAILNDWLNNKGPVLVEELYKYKPMLAICGAYQLLGKEFITQKGVILKGINFLEIYTKASEKRLISDLLADCALLKSYYSEILADKYKEQDTYLIGFENHSGQTYIIEEKKQVDKINLTKPLAVPIYGFGNKDGSSEGAYKLNVIATYSHGSFLPKNSLMTNYLLDKAIERKYGCETLKMHRKILLESGISYFLNKIEEQCRLSLIKKLTPELL